ncbi:iron chaperone [Paenibacillus albus]|uniref:Iron chaperone n=1 Tax=Paenibacillus albus TaxID=2495582 RepID=A0A3S9ADY9_9BACL|nr:iron chaperone [Paenibacillus albus]AZN43962.1 iron chaperone [Paenibacillus albus]
MDVFADYLAGVKDPLHRARTEEVLGWIAQKFPRLVPIIAWKQPMFTDHDTYIIGFSVSKQHMAVAPERAGMTHFADDIEQAGYDRTDLLFRIKWGSPVNYELLERIIHFNIADKADCSTFWRK